MKMATRTGALILLAGVLFLFYLAEVFTDGGGLAFALLIFPISLGFAAQVVFDAQVKMPKWKVFLISVAVTVVLTAILLATQVESMLCAVMAFPIFFGFEFLGIWLARRTLEAAPKEMSSGVKSSLLIVPFLPALFDVSLPVWERFETVTNKVEIAATPDQVWVQIIAFPQVEPNERLWTVSHNLIGAPVPEHSRIADGVRRAVWTNDLEYDEVLTASVKDAHMAWDIRFADGFEAHDMFQRILPNSDQFQLQRGHYNLAYDGAVTTLTLSTDYRLNTTFNAYVAFWGDLFLGDNHKSILHVLKLRAERAL